MKTDIISTAILRSHFFRRYIANGMVALLTFASLPQPLPAASNTAATQIIYFYSPETNINNFSSLKVEFDTYLSSFGAYEFQPFSEQATFEKFLGETSEGIFLISTWHFQNLKTRYPLKPVLVGQLRNRSTQKRVLTTRHDTSSFEKLRGEKIASAGSPAYTRTILRQIYGKENPDLIDSFKIFTVPKDIDALMAVGFGMATAALTTENSLIKLARINPKQHGLLKKLGTTEENLLPIVAVMGKSGNESQELLALMQKMGEQAEGEKRLKMLGLDLLKQLDDRELGMLGL